MAKGAESSRVARVLGILVLTLLGMQKALADEPMILREVLTEAAQSLAESVGTSLDVTRLAGGLCFSEEDGGESSNCRQQAGALLTCGTPALHYSTSARADYEAHIVEHLVFVPSQAPQYEDYTLNANKSEGMTNIRILGPQAIFTQPVKLDIDFSMALISEHISADGVRTIDTSDDSLHQIFKDKVSPDQEVIRLNPGECYWRKLLQTLHPRRLTLNYTVPITGNVAMWLQESKSLNSQEGAKHDWLVPAGDLLKIAKENGSPHSFAIPSEGPATYSGQVEITDNLYVWDNMRSERPCKTPY